MLKASKHEAPPEIRSRRAVGDDDVDRAQVERRRRREPSATNSPKAFHAGERPQRGTLPPEKDNGSRHASRNKPVEKRNGIRVCGQRLRATRPRRRKVAEARERKKTKAVIARGIHLYPFRTEKLSHAAPMVLRKRESRSPPH